MKDKRAAFSQHPLSVDAEVAGPAGDCGDLSLWDGRQQEGRSLRHSHGHAQVPGELLPGKETSFLKRYRVWQFLLHFELSCTVWALLRFSQESGRAGRDGEEARCILLYDYHDKQRQTFLMQAGR